MRSTWAGFPTLQAALITQTRTNTKFNACVQGSLYRSRISYESRPEMLQPLLCIGTLTACIAITLPVSSKTPDTMQSWT